MAEFREIQNETLEQKVTRLEAENADLREQNEKLKELITKDELTGAYNRRGIEEEIKKYIETIQNRPETLHKPILGVLLIDLDKFKIINDTYGHKAGDEVLEKLVQTCSGQLRDLDFLGRYGGEEFLVVLPLADISQSKLVAERLREAVAAMDIEYNGEKIETTVSIGVSVFDGKKTWADTYEEADKFMYMAKEQGRNKVMAPLQENRR